MTRPRDPNAIAGRVDQWAQYDARRRRPRLRPVTVSREVFDAVEARAAAGEGRSALVERALRRELGLADESTGAQTKPVDEGS